MTSTQTPQSTTPPRAAAESPGVAALTIKVRLTGQRRFQFVTHTGGLTAKRVHAGRLADLAQAKAVADDLLASNERVAAAVVTPRSPGRPSRRRAHPARHGVRSRRRLPIPDRSHHDGERGLRNPRS